MKKLLFTLAMLLSFGGVSLAQSWRGDVPQEGDYNHETVVYAKLTSNSPGGSYTVGAFVVEGTTLSCRASAMGDFLDPSGAGDPVYTLRVMGDATGDMGKTIKFKVCDMNTNLEYTLATTLTFDGESHGTPSSPIELTLNIPEWYSLDFWDAEVGKTYNLRDYLRYYPSDATVPDALTWNVTTSDYGDASSYVTIDGDNLTTLRTCSDELILSLITDPAGSSGAESRFTIQLHATSITLNQTSVSVVKGDDATLEAFLSSAYTVTPAGHTDVIGWETENDTIVWFGTTAHAAKGGTTRVRPYVYNPADGSILNPAGNAWITVNVIVPVESINIDYVKFGREMRFNVGDTKCYERLMSIVSVYPEDATDKSVTIEWPSANFTVQGNTSVTAKTEGEGRITIRSANGVSATGGTATIENSINFLVENPATTATFTENPMYVVLEDGNSVDISDRVKNNVTLNGSSTYWQGSVDITGTAVTGRAFINSTGVSGSFTAASEGTSTISVVLFWNDYDNWDGSTTEPAQKSATFSFTVNVTSQTTLAGFNMSFGEAVAGSPLTVTLTPLPDGATFTPADIAVNFTSSLPTTWASTLTSTRKSATATQIVYEVTSEVPGVVNVTATEAGSSIPVYDPSASATGASSSIEFGYPLDLASGWQWRSNPCGKVAADGLQTVYGDNLEEIRTQSQLLYNDPAWGYFGTLTSGNGLLQSQCYKVKMKSARSAVLYGSSVAEESDMAIVPDASGAGMTVTLRPGWNWVGSPYFFNRKLGTAISRIGTTIPEGIVIVAKNGSAESNTLGAWEGDLALLTAGQGYLIKNPETSPITLPFANEFDLAPANETAAGVKSEGLNGHVWQYDDSRFMNNMTMVCVLEDIENPERYSIGAFVGDECRGEGILQGEKAFVTVHCNGGERVSFKLYDTWTGEMVDVDETVTAQTRVGSLKAPFKLHADVQTTAISGINATDSQTESYDLAGRRISGQQPGVSLQRTKNGNFRKVVVK
ncbi:MAG: hypothetical protein IJ762_00580 [Bacteroidaceae bacterium]|nr:hypothetical protein [Bacteroidaceae bacterium]